MQNGDAASLSISPAGCSQLMKMLLTLEPHGKCCSNYALNDHPAGMATD